MSDSHDREAGRRRSDLPLAVEELDDDLTRTLRRTAVMRQGFYVVVLLVALAGQVSGAVEALHIPLFAAVPAVAALELGGVVVLANADVRRRLGEKAIASRLLSAVIAIWAVAFNWLAHANHLLGGFFAGMSALGYLVWLMHIENQRRDRLRAKGDLPPTTPAYELFGHWLRHPLVTTRARSLAKANPGLGLYESLAAARSQQRRERRQAAIAKVLHRKIRGAVDPATADIAVNVYDLDEIAGRLADSADYDGLTALIGVDLAPERLATGKGTGKGTGKDQPVRAQAVPGAPAPGPALPAAETPSVGPAAALNAEPTPLLPPDVRRALESQLSGNRRPITAQASDDIPEIDHAAPIVVSATTGPSGRHGAPENERHRAGETDRPGTRTGGSRATTRATTSTGTDKADRTRRRSGAAGTDADAGATTVPAPATAPMSSPAAAAEMSLRSRVHSALNQHVPADDTRDNVELVELVTDLLGLNDLERHSAQMYVTSWRGDATGSRRTTAPDQARRLRT